MSVPKTTTKKKRGQTSWKRGPCCTALQRARAPRRLSRTVFKRCISMTVSQVLGIVLGEGRLVTDGELQPTQHKRFLSPRHSLELSRTR